MQLEEIPWTSLFVMATGLYIGLIAYVNLTSKPVIAPIGIFIGGMLFGLSAAVPDY